MGGQCEMAGGGWLSVSEAGGRVRLEAVRPMDGKGLYKVWMTGRTGGRMLLGTMIPCGGRLELCRTLSRTALTSAGCYPIVGAEAVMAFPFGQAPSKKEPSLPAGWTLAGEIALADTLLSDAARQCAGLLKKMEGAGFRLAAPYDCASEVPMVTLFCFARVERLDGCDYFTWNFDEAGRPIVGNNFTKDGEATTEADGISPRANQKKG